MESMTDSATQQHIYVNRRHQTALRDVFFFFFAGVLLAAHYVS